MPPLCHMLMQESVRPSSASKTVFSAITQLIPGLQRLECQSESVTDLQLQQLSALQQLRELAVVSCARDPGAGRLMSQVGAGEGELT